MTPPKVRLSMGVAWELGISQGDSTRGFYESLLEEKPDSVMAIRYCVEYGIFAGEK